MRNNYNYILSALVLIFFISSSSLLSQTYQRVGQNLSYSSDTNKNVVFTKSVDGSVDITANLNMLSFKEGSNYYGYDLDGDGGETYSAIPNNWDFEIIELCGSACTNLTNNKKTFTYSGSNNNTITVRIKVFDTSSGQTINNLSNVRLQFFIRDNFTVANATWNACVQAFVLSVNEATNGDGTAACSPYTIKVYNQNDKASGPIYENTQANNTWNLDLDVGKYQADIFNSCGEEIIDYEIDIREAYTFGSEVIFQGFQCVDDTTGLGVIQIQGARIFEGGDYDGTIMWELHNGVVAEEDVFSTVSNTSIIRNNSNPANSIFRSSDQSPHNPPFTYGNVNITLEFPNLDVGTYTFAFKDFNGCIETETIEIKKPLDILSELDQDSSKTTLDCFEDDDGKLTFIASGGWTEPFVGNLINTPANGWGNPYVFTLTDGNGVTYSSGAVLDHYNANNDQDGYEATFSNLPAGTYTLNVTENVVTNPYDSTIIYKCSKDFTQTFTITEPDELVATGTISNNNGFGISCKGVNDGSIDLSVTGGTPDYTYAWTKTGDNTFSKTTKDIDGLGPGTYNVTVTDANDCIDTASFTITEPVELKIADAGLDTAIDCYDGDGQIRINIDGDSNGDGSNQNYTYTLTGTDYNGNAVSESVQTTALNYTFTPKAGTYTVKVTDANGCEKPSDAITLTQPDAPLAVTGTETNVTCNDEGDGEIDITVTGGTANYTYAWTTNGGSGLDVDAEDQTGLTPGTYTVVVTDANDCTITEAFTVTEPDELVATGTISNNNGFGISCKGVNDGSIDLSVTGGTPDYTYAWTKTGDNTFSKTTKDIDGLGPGTYNVTVTDANDCIDTASFTITEPVELKIADAGLDTAIDCYDGDGQIRINIDGDSNGDGSNQNYTYTLTGTDYNGNAVSESVQTTALNYTFTPKAGTYTVKVTDANGCEKPSDAITLTQPNNPLAISESVSNVLCFGQSNGEIDITVTGGTVNYSYQWSKQGDTNYSATSQDITGLSSGTYTVVVTDVNDCTISKTFTVTQPDDLVINSVVSDNNGFEISCNGEKDASINLTIQGGIAPYTFSWTTNGGSGLDVDAEDQINLGPGTYNVTVTDANNCIETAQYVIEEPDDLDDNENIPTTNTFQISCNGANDGAINITPSGGSGSYTFNWSSNVSNSGIVQGQEDQSNLKPGLYTLVLTDSNGCPSTFNYTLTEPNAIIVSAELSDYNGFQISSQGAQDGEIDLTVTGGYLSSGEDYTYTWSTTNGSGLTQGEQDQIGLSAGTYKVIIKDSNDCEEVREYTLSEPAELTLNLDLSVFGNFNIKCFGDDNGSIDLTITGGSGSYTIVWSTSDGGTGLVQGQEDQSGLGPGTYTVKVTDSNNVEVTKTVQITEPSLLEFDSTIPLFNGYAISCNGGNNGSIDISTSGGTGTYTYTWSTSNGSGLTAGAEDQTGLTAGTYFLTLTDSNNCSTTESFVLQEPDAINISAILSDYNSFEVSGAGESDGEINITVVGGIEAYSYQWSTSDGSGLDVNTEDQTGLTAGTYTVLVTDQNLCTETKVYKLSEPDQLSFNKNVSIFVGGFNISCKDADDGSIDITPLGGSGTYTYIWSTNNGSGLVQGDQDQTGLGPGTYSFILRDSNGNESSQDFTLTEPNEVLLSSTISDYNNFEVSCFGGADGEIDISITGGTSVYTYNWTTSNGVGLVQGQQDQTGLTVGSYSVIVTDENGCSITKSFTLTSPNEIAIISTKKDYNGFNVSCNGSTDGEIDIEVSGGYLDTGAVYSYSWTTDGGSGLNPNTEDQTGLSAGSYTVIATDDNGCTMSQTIVITEPDILSISEIISDYNGFQISEAGENDGSINISVSGGTSNYSYVWSTLDGSGLSINNEDQNSLTAGTYSVIVTDTNGCVINKEYTLIEPKELLISLDNDAYKNDVFCYGDSTASIKVDITQGSIAPYTYSINGTTYLNENYSQSFESISNLTYTFTNLTAGSYSITITDANGASKTSAIKEIKGPNNPLGLEGLTTDITCNGAADGIIDITVTGGGGSSNQFTYFYSWTTLDGSGLDSTSEDQSGLGPGTYTVVAKDINDCEITKSFTITQSPPLTYNLDSTKNITCNGDNDGEINITVTGGTGNYTYEWSTENGSGLAQGQEDQSGLGPGNYKLILRDGCNTFEYIYAITTPDTLAINLDEKVDILCHDDSTGKIDISVIGGTLPYNYVWKDNFGNVYDRNVGNVFKDGDLSNIPAGLYDLTVTDANNCIATYSTEITQSEDLLIQIDKTDLNCYDSNDGSIKVTPSGGVAPYTYAWNDFGNGDFRQNLSAGSYQVTITDSNGCIEIRDVEILNAPLFDVNPIVTPVSCFGANDGSIELNFEGGIAPISFNWTDDSSAGQVRNNLSPGLYSVLITDGSGCEIQEDFVIIEPKEISIAGVITDAIDCDNPESGSIDLQVSGGNLPYTFLWSNGATTEDVSNLLANNYSVKITDSKGCTAEKEFSINRQEDLEISLQSDFFAICETKEVYQKNIVTVLGGVAPYTIEWSNGLVSGGNNEIMDTKIEGSYQVTVTDFLGCSESLVFDVTTPVIGSPEFEYDSFYLQTYEALAVNDPITFTNLSTEEYTNVSWDFGDGNTSNEENPVHTYSRRGEYDVTLTVEFILGCSYSITKTIYVGDPYEIVIPNAFTPNNDNFNDVFRPIYYGFKSINIGIYDTWGTLIYSEETTANEMTGWNGRIKGMEAENGNYFYQISGTTHTDEEFSKNGSFTLIK